ncbi:MAG TPA: rhamnulokinase family protein [Propionibacteriaceae bacterium]|nr:rhamnulokinase family protein [Propionibacteriaceae bacterium]
MTPASASGRPDAPQQDGLGSSGIGRVFAAVDIGASSGRVVAGVWTGAGIDLEVVHRFPNGVAEQEGRLRWNLTGLFEEVLIGLAKLAERYGDVVSVGIDTWAVDYGLLDAEGRLLAEPVAYRDARTEAVIDEVHSRVAQERLYAVNGLQYLPFNTLYQLAAEQAGPLWSQVAHAVLLPDLLAYWLTGSLRTEMTNASTTGLLDAERRQFSAEILTALELPAQLFAPLIEPGEVVGTLSSDVAARTSLSTAVSVVAVGSHDTASAVVGIPAEDNRFAFVSSGTWSLVGVELDAPVLTEASRRSNFTNEGGVDATVRYLRNVGGMWLLSESIRTWHERGEPADQTSLLAQAAALPAGGPVVDVDAVEFIAPGDMPDRIRRACRVSGQPEPGTAAEVVRCILDSLAIAYAQTVSEAETLSGRVAAVVHIVGGGSQNSLLCQLTADLAKRPVLAGPVEATALGNVAVQARTAGLLPARLADLRRTLRRGQSIQLYEPDAKPDSVPITARTAKVDQSAGSKEAAAR